MMKKLLLGLAVTLSAALAMYQPALAQTSEEPEPQSPSAQSGADQSSADQHDDADQTTRSSQESSSAQQPQSGPALTPPSPPQGAQQSQSQPSRNQQGGQRQQEGQQQSVLRQPGQQQPAQQQPDQQQLGSQQPEQLPDQQQFDQQQLGSQQPDQQQLGSQQANQQQQNQLQLNQQQLNNQQQFDQQLGIQFQQSNQVAGQGLAISAIQPSSVFFNSGLRQGDVLLSVDNRPILNQAEFVRIIRDFPDPRIPLVVMRGGRRETIFINRPVQLGVAGQPQPVQLSQAILGVTFDPQITNAAIILNVNPGGPADLAGLRSGDQITALNGRMVSSPYEATQVISSMAPGQQLTVDYSRQQTDVRTTAVLVPRSGGRVEYRVGYAPEPATRVITPVPVPRQIYYWPSNRRVEYYYNDYRPRRVARRGWYRY